MKLAALISIFAITLVAYAKETRNEVMNATTLAEDAKLNSDQVPEVYAIEGKFDRLTVLRFKYQADLLAGLEQMVKAKGIRNAVILAGVGSVRGYHYHVVGNRTFPSKNIHVQDPDAPADIAGMNGYVIDGRLHCHITFANAGKAFGGHLEPGTSVFTFAAVTLGVLGDGVDFTQYSVKVGDFRWVRIPPGRPATTNHRFRNSAGFLNHLLIAIVETGYTVERLF